jgi:hypothetical protein
MAEDAEDASGQSPDADADPAAVAVALGQSGALDPRAAAYLEEQTRLTRRRIDESDREDRIRHWSLRVRHIGDVLKLAFQFGIAAFALLLLIAAGTALWNARQANGLVVDSFTAPPNLAAQGIGGDTIAFDLTNRLAHIHNVAVSESISGSGDVIGSGEDDIKVDIPDTGVSLGAVWRYLREWLGRERHVRGTLRQLPDGNISLTVALGGGDVFEASGGLADLGKIENDIAEQVFARFDPVNDVIYLWSSGRYADALRRSREFALSSQPPELHADSYALWGETTRTIAGDIPRSVARERTAIALDPRLAIARLDLAESEKLLGHDEMALTENRATLAQQNAEQPKILQGAGFAEVQNEAEENAASLLGDFALAESHACRTTCLDTEADDEVVYAALLHDDGRMCALLDSAHSIDRSIAFAENRARYEAAAAIGDWRMAAKLAGVRADALAHDDTSAGAGRIAATELTDSRPLLARALAHLGAFAQADAVIASTPTDCYDCVRARGEIEALRGNGSAAAKWFADAAGQAPSIPFAYADWGEMLLAKGDLDAAAAKFKEANTKGPHFADPLEMWGEALIAKNRSDLAVAKFAEAAKYAPNWGRLHLKWGEALLWSGDKTGAKKQFEIAAHLDLSANDKTVLSKAIRPISN